MRQIESAAPREQKFSRHRRHALIDRHSMAVVRDDFRSEEPGRTCSNDGDVAGYGGRIFAHHARLLDIVCR